MRGRIVWALGLWLAAAPAAARELNDEERAVARRHVQAGDQAFDAGLFEAAAAAYEQAHRLVHAPDLTYTLAQAHRLAFTANKREVHLRRAIELYEAYVRAVPSGEKRKFSIQHLSNLQVLLGDARTGDGGARESTRIFVTSRTPGAVARVDGGEFGELPRVVEVEPGERVVELDAPGFFPHRESVTAVKDALATFSVELRPRPARLQVSAPEDAMIFLDGIRIGKAPMTAPAEVPAGEHVLTVTRAGYLNESRKLELGRGAEAAAAVDDMDPTGQRIGARILLASAGAAVLGSITAGVMAWSKEREAIRNCPSNAFCPDVDPANLNQGLTSGDQMNDPLKARNDFRTASYAMAASAGALVVGSLLLYLLDTPEVPAPPPVMSPAPGAGAP